MYSLVSVYYNHIQYYLIIIIQYTVSSKSALVVILPTKKQRLHSNLRLIEKFSAYNYTGSLMRRPNHLISWELSSSQKIERTLLDHLI